MPNGVPCPPAAHLQHLTMVPADDNECRVHLTKVQTSLGRVQMELQALDASVSSGVSGRGSGDTGLQGAEQRDVIKQGEERLEAMKKQAKLAWKSLDEAGSDFKRVADDYKVSVRLPTP